MEKKMKSSYVAYVAAAIVAAAAVAAPNLALARYHHHYWNAPYGHGHPAYHSRYGTYPSYTYDPDPRLRGQLRSDYNRGVDFPGGR
jgi:hypothetical protein